jgi:hypothetical protein
VNAIFGYLLSMAGVFLLARDLINHGYRMLWLPVLLVSVGLLMALRHRRDDDLDQRAGQPCVACGGTGTVHSAEWNDWRQSGPVLKTHEPCPSCQGMN